METKRSDPQAVATAVADATWHYRRVFEKLGIPLDRATPLRHMEALYFDLLGGYRENPLSILGTTFPAEREDPGMVIVKDIPFASVCEHHVLPFTGMAAVGYLPGEALVGLSKIPRLVNAYANRLQLQERLTDQIADALYDVIRCRGVGVILKGHHSCMALRGAKAPAEMVTSAMRGAFLENSETRQEFIDLIR